MKLLTDLYTGNLCPAEMNHNPDAKSELLFIKFEELYLRLKNQNSPKQQEMLTEIFDVGIELALEGRKESFALGFAIGTKLSEECHGLLT